MTILSREHSFAFIHLHKCGGTSVETSYGELAHWSDIILGSTQIGKSINIPYQNQFGLTKHSNVMEIANVIGDDTYQALTGFALVRNPFSTLESFFRWIRRIFSFNARKNNLDINELRRIIANEDQRAQGFHFSGWGTAKAFALHDEFNDFVAASLENRYIPLMPMADRLGVGTHLEPRHIYRLSEIEQFWRALEGHLGKPIPHLHANRSKKKEILRWSEENIQQTSQHFAKDIDVFKMPQRPLNPSE